MTALSFSISVPFSYTIKCSSNKENANKSSIKLNSFSSGLGVSINPSAIFATSFAPTIIKETEEEKMRQNIPTKRQNCDDFRQGFITDGFRYRQTVVVRSYEVGPDKTVTLETILNLLQETALNHVWMSGLLGDGFGATHGMIKNDLIWVVTRMHVQVDKYPIWGEVVDIETWVGASGKNGMRRDWLIKSHINGHEYARGTSTWVMMNKYTRRLSKIPEEVRNEISPWFIERHAIVEDVQEKIIKLDDNAAHIDSDLKPKRSDLDMNHHVNNVKYVKWMLETIPEEFLENHQLSSIILEYRRECSNSDTVQSLCEPDGNSINEDSDEISLLMGVLHKRPTRYTHLLKIKGEQKNEEIVRGRTTWTGKPSSAL